MDGFSKHTLLSSNAVEDFTGLSVMELPATISRTTFLQQLEAPPTVLVM